VTADGRASTTLSDRILAAFEADVEAEMEIFKMPGAAVALVEGNEILYAGGFGFRDLAISAPVSPHTRFRIASNTKSMTAMLGATFVDKGMIAWDQRVIDIWPEFLAPTPSLTEHLRFRDLLGMSSGIGEPATIEFFMSAGAESALDQLRSVAHLPVVAEPETAYFYNNTLVTAAGYLGLIAEGVPPAQLEEAFASLMAERVFRPIGMADSGIGAIRGRSVTISRSAIAAGSQASFRRCHS
jgi:beta-lactamase class C